MNPGPETSASNKFIRNDLLRLSFLCVIVGIVAGLGAIAFFWMLETANYLFLEQTAGFHPPVAEGELKLFPESHTPLRRWVLFFMPAFGGLISGYIVYKFAPEAAGHGTDAAIESYHYNEGRVRGPIVPIVKAISSSITIGTGGSGGREGPIAQIGASMGSILATRINLTAAERRVLMSAGKAAGIGAIFHAPLAAAIFAAEILYKDMDLEHEVLVPSFISSIVAYSIFAAKYGWDPVFVTPDFVFNQPLQLFPYLILAGVVALGAIVYVRVFYGVHDRFEGLKKIPNHVKPAIGGLVVGLIGLAVPYSLGTGYGVIQQAFTSELSIGLLLAIAAAKIMTTSFSIASGGSGGVFGPALVIGGALGGVVGQIAARWLPGLDIDPGAFVMVGMAGFFAAAANCPISTLIMVGEMTNNYHLLVPSMLVCITAYLIATKFTLYRAQLQSRLEAPTKMANMMVAVLRKLSIKNSIWNTNERPSAEDFVTVQRNLPLGEMIRRISNSDQETFPVLDKEGRMTGVVDWDDIRRVLGDEMTILDLLIAEDLERPAVTIRLEDTLLTAVQKINASDVSELVIVEEADDTKPLATLSHNMVLRAYNRATLSTQTQPYLFA